MAKKKAATAASAPVSDALPETNLEDSLHRNQDLSNTTLEADEGHSDPEGWRTFEGVPSIPVKVRIKRPEKSERNCLSLTNRNDNQARAHPYRSTSKFGWFSTDFDLFERHRISGCSRKDI